MHAPQPKNQRIAQAMVRDGAACLWCGYALHAGNPELSTDHLVPKLKGGPAWTENEVPACRTCNRARGHTAPVDWLAQCEARGWHPKRSHVLGLLIKLQQAIQQRGGQRRARPYLDAQIRRLASSLRRGTVFSSSRTPGDGVTPRAI